MTGDCVSVRGLFEVEWMVEMPPDEICQGQRVQRLRCQASYLVIVDAGRSWRMGPWLVSGQSVRSKCKTP